MRVVLRTTILLSLVLSLTIELMRQVGGRLPPPATLHDLRLSDCSLPCWIGIRPGETTLREGLERLQATFALPEDVFPRNPRAVALFTTLSLPDYHTASHRVVIAMQLQIGIPEPRIDAIWWQMSDYSRVTVGDVVGAFGAPTCLYFSPYTFDGWFLIWDSPEGIAEVNVQGGNQISWSEPIDTLMIHTRIVDPQSGQHACALGSPGYRRWSGLLTRDQYRLRREA